MELQAMLYIPEDKDDYQIEIYSKNESRQIAEIYKNKEGELKIEFYNNPNSNEWEVDLKYFIEFLQKSYRELDV